MDPRVLNIRGVLYPVTVALALTQQLLLELNWGTSRLAKPALLKLEIIVYIFESGIHSSCGADSCLNSRVTAICVPRRPSRHSCDCGNSFWMAN
jgi:hypothetical protein